MSTNVDVRTEAVIRPPVEVVSGYAGDPGNAPEWYANIRSVSRRTPPPLAVARSWTSERVPLAAPAMRRANAADLARLGALLEGRGAPTG